MKLANHVALIEHTVEGECTYSREEANERLLTLTIIV